MGAAGGALPSFVFSHRALDRRSISSPHLHPVSSPTSATPRRARGAESQKHDADCGGVRRARPVVLSPSWINGAFSKVAEAGHVAGSRTNRKVPDSCVKYISQNSRASPDP
ncbi:uncharacterized protein LOC119355560 [Triticum dicoccoides]|uniref:uncharacterized protein LOC119355560 n=1 Tax=Triticum dicoccoides TaxID=85692 RepID=UPI00188F5C12|nr:uncharacterized protein LOC119355560 [Triticum dicoccoides]